MKEFYLYFGNLIGNYVVLIILSCLAVKLISIPLSVLSRKQLREKRVRDAHCKELYNQFGDDKEKLTDAIYEYYKTSKYNPVVFYFIKIFIIAINILLIIVMAGTFRPISNFSNISESEKEQILEIYENKYDSSTYNEITIFDKLDDIKLDLEKGNVSNEAINELYDIRDKFELFNLRMYSVPSINGIDYGFGILCIALIFSFSRMIGPLITLIKNKKYYKSMSMQERQAYLIPPIISFISFILSITIIINAPMVICFYFIFQYTYSTVQDIIKIIKNKANKRVSIN